jgi:hypothetical protein
MAYPTKEFQMAAPTTPEDSGRAILAIFKVMGFGSAATLQRDQVQMQFAVNVGDGEGEGVPAWCDDTPELGDGSATSYGWISRDQDGGDAVPSRLFSDGCELFTTSSA